MPFTCTWKKIIPNDRPWPIERSSHGISVISDTVYVFGGEHEARIPIDSDVYTINMSLKALENSAVAWRRIKAGKTSPVPRIAHSQATIGNKIYIFGGRQGVQMEESPLNDLHNFDTVTESWTEVRSLSGKSPSPRSFHRMVAVGKSLFVFGGCGNEGRLSDLHEFNTTTLTWHRHSNVRFNLQNNKMARTEPLK